MKKLIPQSIKNIYHLFQAILANFIYGSPSLSLKVIGVTGTNGKTTTCQMVAKILEEAGHRVAMASTINFKLGQREWVNATKFTTLSPFAVQKFLKQAVEANCEYVVLETSSHSLDQYRVWGIRYLVAAITNVTREHLDYHKTMEKYRQAKLKLFKKAEIAVVNLDMESPEDFLQYDNKEKFGYGTKNTNHKIQDTKKSQISNLKSQNIFAENVELGINGSSFSVDGQDFKLNLAGAFNIENALAAAVVGLSQGISLEQSATALEKITGVPGRLEHIPNNKGIEMMIDYAVTPDSLEKLYAYLTSVKKEGSRIIAVFGSCGERDRGKRPIMGEIVSRYADFVIITNEDPYGEDPMQIIREVAKGVKDKEKDKNFWKILDRRKAITKALSLAKPNDIVIVTGKGAEETMATSAHERIPWNDKKVILEELEKMK